MISPKQTRARFRTVFVVVVVALLIAVLGSTVLIVARVVDSAARQRVTDDLARAEQVLLDHLRDKRRAIRSEASVVARAPRLKAVVAAEDITPATRQDVVDKLAAAVDRDLLFVFDASGNALSRDGAPQSGSERQLVKTALEVGGGTGFFWMHEGRVVLVAAERIDFERPLVFLSLATSSVLTLRRCSSGRRVPTSRFGLATIRSRHSSAASPPASREAMRSISASPHRSPRGWRGSTMFCRSHSTKRWRRAAGSSSCSSSLADWRSLRAFLRRASWRACWRGHFRAWLRSRTVLLVGISRAGCRHQG